MNIQEIINKLNEPIKKYSKKEVYKYVNEFYEQAQEDLESGKASYFGINKNDFLPQFSVGTTKNN